MNVLNSKPQINLKNHISNKNKGESIRYCPKITVPNTLALSVGGGDGSRTHVQKELSVGVSGCRRSTTFPPRHADRQASALVAS